MEELKQRILAEGRGKAEGGVVMVGSFLNHQIDPQLMGLPVVFVKKKNPKTVEESWKSWVWSFTRGDETTVCVDRQFLTAEDRIISCGLLPGRSRSPRWRLP